MITPLSIPNSQAVPATTGITIGPWSPGNLATIATGGIRIDQKGHVGICKSIPAVALDVGGDIFATGNIFCKSINGNMNISGSSTINITGNIKKTGTITAAGGTLSSIHINGNSPIDTTATINCANIYSSGDIIGNYVGSADQMETNSFRYNILQPYTWDIKVNQTFPTQMLPSLFIFTRPSITFTLPLNAGNNVAFVLPGQLITFRSLTTNDTIINTNGVPWQALGSQTRMQTPLVIPAQQIVSLMYYQNAVPSYMPCYYRMN